MNKKIKILIIILLSIILLWGVIFLVDYFRCVNLKMPIFVISGEAADDGGSGTYYGLGYSVEVEKYVSAISIGVVFILLSLLRQIIEPKLVSVNIGLSPLVTLAAIFIGVQVRGIIGIVFCLGLAIMHNILNKVEIL